MQAITRRAALAALGSSAFALGLARARAASIQPDKKTQTGLAGYLKERGIANVYVAGLATDYCVAWSALDARAARFEVAVIEDACRGIDFHGSVAKAWDDMTAAGVKRIQSSDILA